MKIQPTNCVYLLRCLNPKHPNTTYIGFTVHPARRIRQHNGEIEGGAWRTKKYRPWEMVAIVSNFPTKVAAQQFEWAFQHPRRSRALRDATKGLWASRGMSSKLKLLFIMLSISPWSNWNLTLRFLSEEIRSIAQSKGSKFELVPAHIAASITVGPPASHPMYQELIKAKERAKEEKKKTKAKKATSSSSVAAIVAPTQPTYEDDDAGEEDDDDGGDDDVPSAVSSLIDLLSDDEEEEDAYGLVQSDDEADITFDEEGDEGGGTVAAAGKKGSSSSSSSSIAGDTSFEFANDEFGIALLPPLSQILGNGPSSSSSSSSSSATAHADDSFLPLEERLKRRMAKEASAAGAGAAAALVEAKAQKRKKPDASSRSPVRSPQGKTNKPKKVKVESKSSDDDDDNDNDNDDEVIDLSMDDLDDDDEEDKDAISKKHLSCGLCKKPIVAAHRTERSFVVSESGAGAAASAAAAAGSHVNYVDCPSCGSAFHPTCAADYMIDLKKAAEGAAISTQLIPSRPSKCANTPSCDATWLWPAMVQRSKERVSKAAGEKRKVALKEKAALSRKDKAKGAVEAPEKKK
jgi:predicted GIY-YIG superfamily endonuclease